MNRPHVFVVGFPRCGTASLCRALALLGWNPIHNPRSWDQLEGHDAAADVFVTAHWRELLQAFPRAKFILNQRDVNDWLASLKRIPGFWRSRQLFDRIYRRRVYGSDRPSQSTLLNRWDQHCRDVIRTVPERQRLIWRLGDGWEPLCEFLDCEVPSAVFPWLNNNHSRDAGVHLHKAAP